MYIAIWYLSLTYFRGSKALTQVEDGIFRLHTSTCTPGWLEPEADDWDSWGTILLPPHQPTREGLHTLYLSCTPSFANKRFFLETHQEVDLFWALADQTLFLAPFNASCTILNHNLVSVDWHMSKWTQVWFSGWFVFTGTVTMNKNFPQVWSLLQGFCIWYLWDWAQMKKGYTVLYYQNYFYSLGIFIEFCLWLDRVPQHAEAICLIEWQNGLLEIQLEWQLSGNILQN